MKYKLIPLLLAAMMLIIRAPVYASDAELSPDPLPTLYPTSVEDYLDNFGTRCVKKVYRLGELQSPENIPMGDLDRSGEVFSLRDVIKANEEQTETKEHTETVTQDSKSGDMAAVLKQLDPKMEVATEDGYGGCWNWTAPPCR